MAGISTSQLEETVSFMVKTSQVQSNAVKKPSWWPNNLAFFYPIKRRAEHNVLHWRTHLQDIVHKFNKFHNSQRSARQLKSSRQCNNNIQLRQSQRTNKLKRNCGMPTIIIPPFPPPVRTTCRLRRNSTSSSISSSTCSTVSNACSVGEKPAVLKQFELLSASKNKIKTKPLKSPIVHNYINSCNSPIPDNIPSSVSPCKDNYLNYFGLIEKSDIKNSDMINVAANTINNKPHKKYSKHILLCPQIPFSSDMGLKLIKELNEIPQETLERRLERNERFINQATNCPVNNSEEFKISYNTNKYTDDENSHFYIFPTKKYHSPNKLTPRSRYLLQKYCRPCTVSLESLEIKTTTKNKIIKNKKPVLYFKQKENTPLEHFNSHLTEHLRLPLMKPPTVNNNNPSIVLKPINHLFNNKQTHNSNNVKNKIEKHKVNIYYPRRCSTRLKIVKTNDSLTIL